MYVCIYIYVYIYVYIYMYINANMDLDIWDPAANRCNAEAKALTLPGASLLGVGGGFCLWCKPGSPLQFW